MRDRAWSHRVCWSPAFAVAIITLAAWGGAPLAAQVITYTAGTSLGLFGAYPDDFEDVYCDQVAGGFSGWVHGPLTRHIALELNATVSASVGGQTCAIPGIPAPGEGTRYSEDRIDDAIRGVSFFATNVAAVFDPAPEAPMSARARVGTGRLWDKRIWNWFYGGELRASVGPGSLLLGVERWNLGFDVVRETFIAHDLVADELVSTEVFRRSEHPWLIRIGWEGPIG